MILVYYKKLIFLISILILVNCGGGGATPANPDPFSFSTIKSLDPSFSQSFSLTGSDTDGDSFTATFVMNNLYAVVINSVSVVPREYVVNITNVSTGWSVSGVMNEYYSAGYVAEQRLYFSSGVTCNQTNSSGLPDSAKIGEGGAYVIYDCSDGSKETVTWRLEQSGSNAKLIFEESTSIGGSLDSREEDAYIISTNGHFLGIEIKVFFPPDYTLNLSGS